MSAETATSTSAVMDLVLRLRAFELFHGLPLESLHGLALAAEVVRLAPGQQLARSGEPWRALNLVLQGTLEAPRADMEPVSRERAELMGALAVLSGTPLPCPIVARGTVDLLRVPADALTEVLEEDFGATFEVLRNVARLLVHSPVSAGGLPPGPPVREPEVLDLVERMMLLRRAFRLESASITSFADLARGATQSVADGTTLLWRAGDPAGEAVLVVAGSVELSKTAQGTQRVGPQGVLGALDLIASIPRRYDALPSAGTVLLHMPAAQMLSMLEDHFDAALDVIAVLSRDALKLLCGCAELPS